MFLKLKNVIYLQFLLTENQMGLHVHMLSLPLPPGTETRTQLSLISNYCFKLPVLLVQKLILYLWKKIMHDLIQFILYAAASCIKLLKLEPKLQGNVFWEDLICQLQDSCCVVSEFCASAVYRSTLPGTMSLTSSASRSQAHAPVAWWGGGTIMGRNDKCKIRYMCWIHPETVKGNCCAIRRIYVFFW